MTTTADIADFVLNVDYDNLEDEVVRALKKRVLDTVGIGIGALGEAPVASVYDTVQAVDDGGEATLWGRNRTASPVQAAMHNTALTRYLDYMDSFLAPGETPHPSDTIASIVACGESVDASGEELLAAVGVAYEVQAALAWNAPVRDRGFDHVTHTVIAATAGCAHILELRKEEIQHAVGIAGTAHNALRVTRTEGINAWKGIAAANAARNAVYSCLLAKHGMEGPKNLFEGKKGWKQVISGDFDCDYDRGCTAVKKTMAKKYVAETYAQSAVEGIIELAEEHDLSGDAVASIHLDTFHGAKLIIGGGEGDRHAVETKAQADHSLPYMLAAALIDREMTNAAYDPERITREDVQRLLQQVTVAEDAELTSRFENGEMPAELTVTVEGGEELQVSKDAFDGHPTDPASWEMLESKASRMMGDRFSDERIASTVDAIETLEARDVADLTAHL